MHTKKIYIIAGILFIAGIVIFMCGFSITGFNINKLNTNGESIECNYSASNEITKVNLDTSNVDIIIKQSNDSKINVTYFEDNNTKYIIDKSGSTLNIKKEYKTSWFSRSFFNFDLSSIYVKIEIPKDYSGDLVIETSNGKIELNHVTLRYLELKTSNGRIDIGNVIVADTFDVKTSNGKIELNNVEAECDITCITNNGKINLTNVSTSSNIKCDTSNDKINLRNVKGDYVDIKTSSGKIEFYEIDVKSSLKLKTSNDPIEGTIIGSESDFRITSKTSNGKNNLAERIGSGDKVLDVKTSNDNIKINFTQ